MLIGICGKKSSGKSYIARYFKINHKFEIIKFADPLKNMLYSLGLSNEDLEGKLKETPNDILCGNTPRMAMQSLGTQWGRDIIGKNIWINIFKNKVKFLLDNNISVVCDDVRFENEYDTIKELRGYTINIKTDIISEDNHESEHSLPSNLIYDAEIYNFMNKNLDFDIKRCYDEFSIK